MSSRRLIQSSILLLALLLIPAISRAADATTQPSGATGTWKWTQQGPQGDVDFSLKLKQDGDKLTGTLSGFNGNDTDIQDGKIDNGQITFKIVRDFNGNQVTTNYTLTLDGGELKGKSETVFTRSFDAKRGD